MKIAKTGYKMDVNTSTIIYLCESRKTASDIRDICEASRSGIFDNVEWYFSISLFECKSFCLVPKFFHNKGYWVTMLQFNRGDWSKGSTYELNLVED